MTKDIQILKFAVRRSGVRFGPGLPAGAIMYDLPADEADKLIAESNGTIVELPKREAVERKVAAVTFGNVGAGGNAGDSTPPTAGKDKPLERMNRDELAAQAALKKIALTGTETKAQIIALLKQAPPAADDGLGFDLGAIDPSSTVGK